MGRNTYGYETGFGQCDSSNLRKESMNFQLPKSFEDPDNMEEEDSVFNSETELKNKNQRQEPIEVSKYSKMESSITTRRRAILTGRDISSGLGAGPTHFPALLLPATSRKQKEQLSEVEQQMKRAEAAKRRRIQNEKATRESEAEAIRKILGQDSSKKKREEKIKKQQENRAQERTSNSATVASNVSRWVMGPSGTLVTFPEETGLPSISNLSLAAILFHKKNVPALHVQLCINTEIRSRISLFAAFCVTRQYTRRDHLLRLVDLVIIP